MRRSLSAHAADRRMEHAQSPTATAGSSELRAALCRWVEPSLRWSGGADRSCCRCCCGKAKTVAKCSSRCGRTLRRRSLAGAGLHVLVGRRLPRLTTPQPAASGASRRAGPLCSCTQPIAIQSPTEIAAADFVHVLLRRSPPAADAPIYLSPPPPQRWRLSQCTVTDCLQKFSSPGAATKKVYAAHA